MASGLLTSVVESFGQMLWLWAFLILLSLTLLSGWKAFQTRAPGLNSQREALRWATALTLWTATILAELGVVGALSSPAREIETLATAAVQTSGAMFGLGLVLGWAALRFRSAEVNRIYRLLINFKLGRLAVGVIAGVVLAAVPTYYSLFPPEVGSDTQLRAVIFLSWLIIAGLVVFLAGTREEVYRGFIADQARTIRSQLEDAELIVLEELLRSGTRGAPTDFKWRVHSYDDRKRVLSQSFPPDPDPVLKFKPRQGAVGAAYDRGRPIVVIGDPVSDATWGLTAEQQDRFRAYHSVVAAPIKVAGRTIAVLSAVSDPVNDYFTKPAGEAILAELAAVGAVLSRMSPSPAELQAAAERVE